MHQDIDILPAFEKAVSIERLHWVTENTIHAVSKGHL